MISRPRMDAARAAVLMEPLTELAAQAGAAILKVNRTVMTVDGKADGSPVTEADLAADHVIGEGLARLFPGIPSLSEERLHLATPPYAGTLFLIDPLDGTKEFVAGRQEFTVNIALIVDGAPLLGIVGAPALGLIWRGLVGRGAERVELAPDLSIRKVTSIQTRAAPARGRSVDRCGQPFPWRPANRGFHRQPPRRCQTGVRLGAEILPRGRGPGRHLSAAGADLRMGCGCGPCRGGGCRRQGDRHLWQGGSLRRQPGRLHRAGIHRLG